MVFLAFATYQGLTLRVYSLTSPKLNSNQPPLRFILITDLHSYLFRPQQKPLLNLIQAQNPDYIFLVGDIIDDHRSIDGARIFLEKIAQIAPTYYVTGNHEKRLLRLEPTLDHIRDQNITVIDDQIIATQTASHQPLIFAGLRDPEETAYHDLDNQTQFQIMQDTFAPLATQSAAYQILLAHRPEQHALYNQFNFDLILSGHTHGGQARIPYLINGLYAPNQGFFPSRAGGHYQDLRPDGQLTDHIVGRGLELKWQLPRFFNPPEVVLIEVSAKN